MKQEVKETFYGKTLIIEDFDPITTAVGLTARGVMELDSILIKNCLNCKKDILIIKRDHDQLFELSSNLEQYELKKEMESLVDRWLKLTVNEKFEENAYSKY